jgi:hypothetical protein
VTKNTGLVDVGHYLCHCFESWWVRRGNNITFPLISFSLP